MYQLKLLEPSKHYVFISFTLLVKSRVNIYLSWTVYMVILGENPPITNF